MSETDIHTGSCLCRGVRYEVRGPLRGIVMCHCTQCRKTSGHVAAMTSVPAAALSLVTQDSLVWYRSSAAAERGFCNRCGGNLFWRYVDGDVVSISGGSLDSPTHVSIEEHIYVADKADYYEIRDAVPQKLQG